MKKRRDYLVNTESASGVADPPAVYHGTLKEAKRAVRGFYKKMKDGDRLIIRDGNKNNKIVSEYYKKEGWLDFIAEEIVKKS